MSQVRIVLARRFLPITAEVMTTLVVVAHDKNDPIFTTRAQAISHIKCIINSILAIASIIAAIRTDCWLRATHSAILRHNP